MNNKLSEILSRSKAVMQKAEMEYGSTSSVNTNTNFSSEEKEIPNLTENYINRKTTINNVNSVAPKNGRYRNMENSKLPDFIKEAMINDPIEIPETPFPTFDIDDVPELVNETKTYTETTYPKNTNTSLNEDIIRKIVKEEMEDVVRNVIEEYLDKSLVTEDIQIRVGGTTFSGKLKPLPNKRK